MPTGIYPHKKKSHCKRGHEFTPENTCIYLKPRYGRYCLKCRKLRIIANTKKPGIGKGGAQAGKQHCPKGHEYTPENTYSNKNNGRKCRMCICISSTRFHAERKKRIVDGYGGKCMWPEGCAITDSDMLAIDHVNDDGAQERVRGKVSNTTIYNKIIRHNFPPEYQILCANHNIKKQMLKYRRERHDS